MIKWIRHCTFKYTINKWFYRWMHVCNDIYTYIQDSNHC